MPNASRIKSMHLDKFWPQLCLFAFLTIAGFAACNRSSTAPAPASPDKSAIAAASTTGPVAKSVDLEKPVVQIETSAGSITLQLDGIRAPGTVRNFLNYVNDGFYENTL